MDAKSMMRNKSDVHMFSLKRSISTNSTQPQIRYSNRRTLLWAYFLRETPQDTFKPLSTYYPFDFENYNANVYDSVDIENQPKVKKERKIESRTEIKDAEAVEKKYEELHAKYLKLLSEMTQLKNENEELKLFAYKSYKDIREERDYEISKASMNKDSLLILMELRENQRLNYLELIQRVTLPEELFLRLAELVNVNFVSIKEKNGYFSITPGGIAFLENRGL